MKLLVVVLLSFFVSQSEEHLSPAEVTAAIAAKPNSGFIYIADGGFTIPSACPTQMPAEAIFTPSGWLNALAINAKRQFLPFAPSPADTAKVLRVRSEGCVGGTPAGPVCDSITRVVLLSDKTGRVVIEAANSVPISSTWQNGFGATAQCSAMMSQFPMSELSKVQNENREFQIATFSGGTLLKIYTVKQKHLRQLGL